MNKVATSIESLLLVAGKPMAITVLAKFIDCSNKDVDEAIIELEKIYNKDDRGIHIMVNDKKVQLTTNPNTKKIIADFIKDETTGELTKPSLETLTIIAYRQPITKEELEQIRGVNCSLILRNLLIRGLIETHEQRGGLATDYSVTMEFLRFLGVNRVEELPEYDRLHSHEAIEEALTIKQED